MKGFQKLLLSISWTECRRCLQRLSFEKYDFSTMIYVIESLCETTTQIKNPRQYILATLYNAPSTANLNMNMKVNHDLYGN